MLTLLWTLPICVMLFVNLRQITERLASGLNSDIPPGTVFEMKDGTLTNNLNEPLVFREENAVVIINAASSTLGLAEGENGIVINSTFFEEREGARSQSVNYKDAPNFRISREEAISAVTRWAPLVIFLGSLFVLVLMVLVFWGGLVATAIVYGFMLWLMFKIIKRPHRWRQTFVIAAYAATASTLTRMVLQAFGFFSALPDLIYLGFILWIAYDTYKGGSHEPKEGIVPDGPDVAGGSKPV